MSHDDRADVMIIGASFAGLFAAAAAAGAGVRVQVVERDELPDRAEPRPGVPQGVQPHVLLYRGLVAAEALLPGFEQDLLDAGGLRYNSGQMPWLSRPGWMPITRRAYDIVSISRPLMELVVRRRVQGLPGVEIHTGARVSGIRPTGSGWEVHCADGAALTAGLVIDASGRGSRLPHWLEALGYRAPEPLQVDAKLGYASRRYQGPTPPPVPTGVVLLATPETATGGLALPVEQGQWLVMGGGYGDRRPARDPNQFVAFLAGLRDPAVWQLVGGMEPLADVAIHRQTGNQRRPYARRGPWPAKLLVMGDALCAFNPIYGQGITVAACQAELLRRRLGTVRDERTTRRLQRRLSAATNFPWSVATAEDLRYPSCNGDQNRVQRLLARWTDRMTELAAGGDECCGDALIGAYQLMASPRTLFSPGVVRSVSRSLIRGIPPPTPRPAVLERLGAPDLKSPAS
jgi:2-polyprenyl-6-methoxyphenol hydroxylase-like FAD-dependent oxidoreductase